MKVDYEGLFYSCYQDLVLFSEDDKSLARDQIRYQQVAAKEHFFTANDTPKDIHFLINGIGRYYYIDSNGKERNKSIVCEGGAFASMSSTLNDVPSPFYTQAISDCLSAKISYQTICEVAKSSDNWALFMRRMYEILVLEKEQREASLLMKSARERYQEFLDDFGPRAQEIPLKHIALYIGISDVSLSRIRKEMGLT